MIEKVAEAEKVAAEVEKAAAAESSPCREGQARRLETGREELGRGRRFVVDTFAHFAAENWAGSDTGGAHWYEYFGEGRPVALYFDLECPIPRNPDFDPDVATRAFVLAL